MDKFSNEIKRWVSLFKLYIKKGEKKFDLHNENLMMNEIIEKVSFVDIKNYLEQRISDLN